MHSKNSLLVHKNLEVLKNPTETILKINKNNPHSTDSFFSIATKFENETEYTSEKQHQTTHKKKGVGRREIQQPCINVLQVLQ